MRNKTLRLSGLIMVLFIIVSCASVNHVAKRITIKSGQIPPDMQTEKFTLIGIVNGKKSYDKYVKKKFSEYTGEYVLAEIEEVDEKYKDVNKYRYILSGTLEVEYSAPTTLYGQPVRHSGFRCYIFDRKEDKMYRRKRRSSFFALEIEACLTAIEMIRKKD